MELELGVTLPTGATDVRNDEGVLAEPSLQPGTGALGVLAGLNAVRRFDTASLFGGAGSAARLFADYSFRTNAKGKDGYRVASEMLLVAGARYPVTPSLSGSVQLTAQWRGKDETGSSGEFTDATGGVFAYVSPGFRYLVAGMAFYGYVQLPILRDVNGVQITAESNLLVGLGYDLGL